MVRKAGFNPFYKEALIFLTLFNLLHSKITQFASQSNHMFIIYQKRIDVSLFCHPDKKQARFGADGCINIHLFAIIRLKIALK